MESSILRVTVLALRLAEQLSCVKKIFSTHQTNTKDSFSCIPKILGIYNSA